MRTRSPLCKHPVVKSHYDSRLYTTKCFFLLENPASSSIRLASVFATSWKWLGADINKRLDAILELGKYALPVQFHYLIFYIDTVIVK